MVEINRWNNNNQINNPVSRKPGQVQTVLTALMFVVSSPRRLQHLAARRIPPVVCIAVVGLLALTGCGSSKPAYCSTRTDLENSVKGLESSIKGLSLSNLSTGISDVKTEVNKIQSDANTLVSQVKGEFASQTSAIKSSVTSLGSANGLLSSPSVAQIDAVKSAASGVETSVKSFTDATSAKCS